MHKGSQLSLGTGWWNLWVLRFCGILQNWGFCGFCPTEVWLWRLLHRGVCEVHLRSCFLFPLVSPDGVSLLSSAQIWQAPLCVRGAPLAATAKERIKWWCAPCQASASNVHNLLTGDTIRPAAFWPTWELGFGRSVHWEGLAFALCATGKVLAKKSSPVLFLDPGLLQHSSDFYITWILFHTQSYIIQSIKSLLRKCITNPEQSKVLIP